MEPKTVIIKKYENRRLYDTTNSRYVNLDEVAQMLRDGIDVRVVDAGTGEDLTRLILTQIVVEDAKGRNSGFPLDILRQMVVASGKVSQETILKNMQAMFEMYQNAYRALTPFDFMQGMAGAAKPSNPAPDAKAAAPEGKRSEVEELRRRLEELEKQMASGPGKKGRNRGGRR
jgi:polyhydroxyalkanoate synthesis repressor PhaR